MNGNEFARLRKALGKSQSQLAKLLCVSTQAIQSYEQGWRDIPSHAERQLLFASAAKTLSKRSYDYCWKQTKCPLKWRKSCSAWDFKVGNFCWFINGTFCQGNHEDNWAEKIKICHQCDVFRSTFP